MCPNIDTPKHTICPPGPLKNDLSSCRFVKTYIDKRGWIYKVMGGIGSGKYKARYQKPGETGWKCYKRLEWHECFDHAQSDLNALAQEKGWMVYDA